MWKDDSLIIDLLVASRKIVKFCEGIEKQVFLKDEKTQSAVLYQIAIIGEASNKLSEQFREKNPNVPWKDMIGMRNRLVHDYRNVFLERVWEVIAKDIPELLPELEKLEPNQDEFKFNEEDDAIE